MVYWSDVALNGIYRMGINGSGRAVFLQDGIGTVDGVFSRPLLRNVITLSISIFA